MESRTILIADENMNLLTTLRVKLQAEGFEIITSQEAHQALALAQQDRPDLLLFDVDLPAGEGVTVQKRLAAIRELSETPIVYFAGEVSPQVDITAAELGAYAVVTKPIDAEALLDTIRGALGLCVQSR
jgi:DNA-binding response OmpR family regulator